MPSFCWRSPILWIDQSGATKAHRRVGAPLIHTSRVVPLVKSVVLRFVCATRLLLGQTIFCLWSDDPCRIDGDSTSRMLHACMQVLDDGNGMKDLQAPAILLSAIYRFAFHNKDPLDAAGLRSSLLLRKSDPCRSCSTTYAMGYCAPPVRFFLLLSGLAMIVPTTKGSCADTFAAWETCLKQLDAQARSQCCAIDSVCGPGFDFPTVPAIPCPAAHLCSDAEEAPPTTSTAPSASPSARPSPAPSAAPSSSPTVPITCNEHANWICSVAIHCEGQCDCWMDAQAHSNCIANIQDQSECAAFMNQVAGCDQGECTEFLPEPCPQNLQVPTMSSSASSPWLLLPFPGAWNLSMFLATFFSAL